MFNIGEKLKTLRTNAGLTQPEVAEKINITKPTYAAYEKGKDISINTLNELAKVFNIPFESFFMDNVEKFKKIENKGTIKRIPIISRVSAGKGEYGTDDILEWLEMPVSLCDGADYATFVKGDSMEPKILDGDLILIKKDEYLDNGVLGDMGIFKINDDVFCKKYFNNPITKEVILKSLNSKYDPIYLDEHFQGEFYILGRVICKIDYNF